MGIARHAPLECVTLLIEFRVQGLHLFIPMVGTDLPVEPNHMSSMEETPIWKRRGLADRPFEEV